MYADITDISFPIPITTAADTESVSPAAENRKQEEQLMKKPYQKPEAEIVKFDAPDTITTSTRELTEASTQWWTCESRYVDVKNAYDSLCGYV